MVLRRWWLIEPLIVESVNASGDVIYVGDAGVASGRGGDGASQRGDVDRHADPVQKIAEPGQPVVEAATILTGIGRRTASITPASMARKVAPQEAGAGEDHQRRLPLIAADAQAPR